MTDLRTAAQQALEALEEIANAGAEDWGKRRPCVQEAYEQVDALRAALAQQAEPAAYRHQHEWEWEYYDAPTGEDCANCQPLYTAPPVAQRGSKPTAWMLTDVDNPNVRFLEWQQETRPYRGEWIKTPLYAGRPLNRPDDDEGNPSFG